MDQMNEERLGSAMDGWKRSESETGTEYRRWLAEAGVNEFPESCGPEFGAVSGKDAFAGAHGVRPNPIGSCQPRRG